MGLAGDLNTRRLARELAAAGATVLRPGGSWFALTHDVHHYFGVTARVAHHLGWP